MADVITTVYDFTKPEVGASESTWGTKLNANWQKVEDLFAGAFTGGSPTALGELKAANMPDLLTKHIVLEYDAPRIRLHDTDETDPSGRWQLSVTSNVFSIQKATAANWATVETALSINSTTKEVIITSPYSLQLATTAVEIASTTAELRFAETDQTDPTGRYRFLGSGGFFYLQKAATAAWASTTTLWSYSPSTSLFTFSAAAAFTGDVKISNSIPYLWLNETDGTTQPNWGLWVSSDTFNIGELNSSGAAVTSYINMFNNVAKITADIFRIQSGYPTIHFYDTTPSGTQYFNITAGNGNMRISTATSAGLNNDEILLINTSGLTVQTAGAVTGDIHADNDIIAGGQVLAGGLVTGSLKHINAGGYVQIGAFSGAYGSGYGEFYWSDTDNKFVFLGDIHASGGNLIGNGSSITSLDAAQISSVAGAIGTYRTLLSSGSGDASGASVAGSALATPNLKVNTSTNALSITFSGGPSGTWRAMQTTSVISGERAIASYLRIA